MSDARTPAGWYDDGSGNQRYWDGNAWTEHTAPGPAAAPAAGADASPAAAAAPASFAATSGQPTAPGSPVATSDATFAPAPGSDRTPHVLGIIALVVAAIGFIFACIPFVPIVGWILLPTAFVLSIVALFLKGAKWPAITGLALSIVGTIIGVIVFVTIVSASFTEAFDDIEGAIAEASESAEAFVDDEEPATDEPDAGPVGNLAFGDTMIYEDDVELTVSAPEPYTPSEVAAGATLANNIVFTMTIRNNSTENFEPLPYVQLSSGGQEASQIFDITGDGQDVGVPPTTVILPGESVTWRSAWSVADPASLTMQVAPTFGYEEAIFTNIQ